MSTYVSWKMTVRGNSEILDEFVRSFEGELDDIEIYGSIKTGRTRDGYSYKCYQSENCYSVEGEDYYFIGIETISIKYPSLKLEYLQTFEGGWGSVYYMICMNGNTLDYSDGKAYDFHNYPRIYIDHSDRCELCNSEFYHGRGICDECYSLKVIGLENQNTGPDDEIGATMILDEEIWKLIEADASKFTIEDEFIVKLPGEIRQLRNLKSLVIKNCYRLENIPAEISQLENLRSFTISQSKISSFSKEFWQLVNLNSLEILACPRLLTLPEEIGSLTNLASLRITGCENLENLPEEMGNLHNLTSLRVVNCRKLELTSIMSRIPNLSFLEIDGKYQIQEKDFPISIPDDIPGLMLSVVNKSGETIALFYLPGLVKAGGEFNSAGKFCNYYDQLFDDYYKWDNAGLNIACRTPEEQEAEYKEVLQGLRWDPHDLMRIKTKKYSIKLMGLCRLAYPYHCQENKVMESLLRLSGTLDNKDLTNLDDVRVLRKASEFDLIESISL